MFFGRMGRWPKDAMNNPSKVHPFFFAIFPMNFLLIVVGWDFFFMLAGSPKNGRFKEKLPGWDPKPTPYGVCRLSPHSTRSPPPGLEKRGLAGSPSRG